MRIKQLRIENFRGVKELSIDFSNHLNVIAGINGAGKSTILDASAILLSWFSARIRNIQANGRPISEFDIKNKESTATLRICVDINGEVVEWKIAKSRKGRLKSAQSDLDNLNDFIKKYQGSYNDISRFSSLPLLVYYPVNRAVIDIPLRIRNRHYFDDPMSSYDGSLTSGADFRVFFEWFREREDLENELLIDTHLHKNKDIKPDFTGDSQLQAVRAAIEAFTGFNDLRIRRQPLRMELNKNGTKLRIEQLSNGEKCLLAMIGDLARRLSIVNTGLDEPLAGSGIVMIDEIDLHLHPGWQRMVIQKISQIFPNCQFVVSTHSPQILSHVKKQDIFLLEQKNAEEIVFSKPSESFGQSSDRILEDLMDVPARPVEIEKELHTIFQLIDKGSLKSAKDEIIRIREKIGEDPLLIRADVLIRRKESIGK